MSACRLDIPVPAEAIKTYQAQRRTIVAHRRELRANLNVRRFGEAELDPSLWLASSSGKPRKSAG